MNAAAKFRTSRAAPRAMTEETSRFVWAVVACFQLHLVAGCGQPAGCGDSDQKPAEAPKARGSKSARPRGRRRSRATAEKTESIRLEDKVKVTFTIPAGWEHAEQWGDQPVYKRADYPKSHGYPRFFFSATCGGRCDEASLVKAEKSSLRKWKKRILRPNINSGDPKLEAVRGSFEVVKEAKLDSGHLLAGRLTYSKEVLESGPYKQRFYVRCTFYEPGLARYVVMHGYCKLEDEELAAKPLVEVCESVELEPVDPG